MNQPTSWLRTTALALATLLLLSGACDLRYEPEEGSGSVDSRPVDASPPPLPEGAEARSLLGDPLIPPEPSEEARARQEALLTEAREALAADSMDADAAIWVGRRLAYLGRYNDAIEIYTEGIQRHPEDPRFYRHRGHRYVTTRRFEDAIRDFERAVELVADTEDRVEPDGLPNTAGIPLSTLQFNIWYHLGLAHYLSGDLESALGAYRQCMEVSVNPDLQVATGHWLYMTLRELGLDDEAATLLERYSADMEIIENDSYHQLLLMYRGERDAEELLGDPAAPDASRASTVYGVGNWYRYNGDPERAREIFEAIVEGSDQWAAFGYVAAEAVLARGRQEG